MSNQHDHDKQWAAFLDHMVHDLREPMRQINTFSAVLSRLPEERRAAEAEAAIAQIMSGAARLRDLTDGLAGYSLAINPSPGATKSSLRLALSVARATLEKQIQDTGATITAGDLPSVAASHERLAQLFTNLLANSLRFRAEAAPIIHVSASADPSGHCLVEVHDNGIGIDPADCDEVFRPFTRLWGRKYPGAGLGLYTCRRIVGNHGGTIRIAPNPDGGAICSFTLPAA